jgi:5'-nucleotidase
VHLLLTNDDGVEADGLVALYDAAREFGQVTVVAPGEQRSGCGHAVTYKDALTITTAAIPRLGRVHFCDGTPADCVRLALAGMALEPVDWVLAGVNRGANLGVDVFYSGTIAAVREAAILGCRGISISQFVRSGQAPDWDRVTVQVRHLLAQLLERNDARPMIWSVNLPLAEGGPPAVRVTTLSHDPLPMQFERVKDDGGGTVSYRYSGAYPERLAAPGTDVAAVLGGDISVTPLGLDGTDATGLGHSFEPPGV